MNAYETLGVPKDATIDTIKKAYKKKAQKSHPDRGGTEEEFKDLSTAYSMVSSPDSRARYDATGDATIPDIDAKARSMAIQAVIQFVEQGSGNYLLEATKAIQGGIQKANAGIKETESKIAKLEKSYKRLKPVGKDTFLLDALKNHIIGYQGKIVLLKDQVDVFNRVIEFLTMFELEGNEPDSHADIFAQMIAASLKQQGFSGFSG